MKKLYAILALALLSVSAASALEVIDFEGIPQDYWYFGGAVNLGSYYSGVTFGPTTYILETQIYGYNDASYPPHSPVSVAVSISDPNIRADFTTGTVSHVGVWYTSGAGTGLYLEGYDAGNNLVASTWGADNTGTNSFLEINGAGIAYAIIHDSGDFFTIDDFEYTPESTATQVGTWSDVKALY
ncbi:hypothetical protein H8E52_11665 [bacterium]|nr:hypothetical protein [bacterium]